MPIIIKLNYSKIPKDRLFDGKNGKYIDLVLFENKAPDQYGNHGFVSVSVSKEERDAGTRGEIVGNWKDTSRDREQQREARAPRRPAPAKPKETKRELPEPYNEGDIPFRSLLDIASLLGNRILRHAKAMFQMQDHKADV